MVSKGAPNGSPVYPASPVQRRRPIGAEGRGRVVSSARRVCGRERRGVRLQSGGRAGALGACASTRVGDCAGALGSCVILGHGRPAVVAEIRAIRRGIAAAMRCSRRGLSGHASRGSGELATKPNGWQGACGRRLVCTGDGESLPLGEGVLAWVGQAGGERGPKVGCAPGSAGDRTRQVDPRMRRAGGGRAGVRQARAGWAGRRYHDVQAQRVMRDGEAEC